MREHTTTQKRTPFSRVFSIITALFMTLLIIPDIAPIRAEAAPEVYDITIGGVAVTSDNKDDITGNGALSYDPGARKLTLRGDLTDDHNNSIESHVPDLTIYVEEDSNIATAYGINNGMLQLYSSTVITGPGKLTTARINCNDELNIIDANVVADHPTINTSSSAENIMAANDLTITNSDVYAARHIYSSNGDIILNNTHIASPANTAIAHSTLSPVSIIKAGTSNAEKVHIKRGYGFKLFGTEITSAMDLSKLGKKGEFSFEPDTDTLTLNKDVTWKNSSAVLENVSNINLKLNGNGHKISEVSPIKLGTDTTLTGKLSVQSDTIAFSDMFSSKLTIKDAELSVTAKTAGFSGPAKNASSVLIDNSSVSVELTVSTGKAFSDIKNGISLNNCLISYPDNYAFTQNATEIDAAKLTITPAEVYPLYVAGIQVNECNRSNIYPDGDVTYDPITKRLSINDDIETRMKWCIDNQGVDGLIICNKQNVYLGSSKGGINIADGLETTIESSSGQLNISCSDDGIGINCGSGSALNIECADVRVDFADKGIYCARNDSALDILDSKLMVTNASDGAISGFNEGLYIRGCELTNGCIAYNGAVVSADDISVKSTDIQIVLKDKVDISAANLTIDTLLFMYDGQPHCPGVNVTYGGRTLVVDKDYRCVCEPATEIGTYYATIYGLGDFKGSKSIHWIISDVYLHEPLAAITFSHNVSLNNNLGLIYYVSAAKLEGFENVRLVVLKDRFNADGSLASYTEETVSSYVIEDSGYGDEYVFRYNNIAAKEMASDVRVFLRADRNNITFESPIDVYSIKQYAMNKLNKNTTSDTLKTLLVDMLNYGAAAQTYFGYNTANLANSSLTAQQRSLATDFDSLTLINDRSETALSGATAIFHGNNLSLGNNVAIVYYMKFDNTVNKNKVTLKLTYTTVTGVEITKNIPFSKFTAGDYDDEYRYDFSDIAAKDSMQPVTAVLYENGRQISSVLIYSIQSYAYSKLSKSTTSPKLCNIIKAMMVYYNSAKNYFV